MEGDAPSFVDDAHWNRLEQLMGFFDPVMAKELVAVLRMLPRGILPVFLGSLEKLYAMSSSLRVFGPEANRHAAKLLHSIIEVLFASKHVNDVSDRDPHGQAPFVLGPILETLYKLAPQVEQEAPISH